MIQELTGSTTVESRKLVGVGRMLAEADDAQAQADAEAADAARRLLDDALDPAFDPDALDPVAPHLPPTPLPWHAPISRAVNDGMISIDAGHALRTGLGDIDTVVTGQVRVDGLFPPEQGEFIKSTFDSLTSPRRGGVRFVDTDRAAWAQRVKHDPRTTTQITCDGFLDLLKAGTTINPNEILGGRRPAVQILTTTTPAAQPAAAGDIPICPTGQTGHGYIEGNNAPVSPETLERLICDSGSVEIRFDEHDRPLDLGHEQRLFNRAQRRAMAARDGGCMWPGCDRPPAFTEAHHIEHWLRDHGRTDINQGILLCQAHHMLLHNQRWQVFENAGRYRLRPPATIDPGQTLIAMPNRNQPRRI